MPLIGFSYSASIRFAVGNETFILLVFTYGASENAIFVHLGLNSMP